MVTLFIVAGCVTQKDEIVGSEADIPIDGVQFVIQSKSIMDGSFFVSGIATNLSTKTITSPWYIEAQFYTDTTYQIKIGGTYVQIGNPLEPLKGIIWTMQYSKSGVNLGQYVNFGVSDLRAVYKKN